MLNRRYRRGSHPIRSIAIFVFAAGLGCAAFARCADVDKTADALREIVVIGTTPVPGMGIDIDKIPSNVQTLSAADLIDDGSASLTAALEHRLSGISITDTLADPFQPDILYRGFEASPVLGSPQGLAVYQNGVRVNEAFGDSVNWDLIPDFAINRIDLVSSNPSYGLNALGGALSVTMENAFNTEGAQAEVSGGSFNRRTGSVEYSAKNDTLGIYMGAKALHQNGWRLFADDYLHQFYVDLSLRNDPVTADFNYTRADNFLAGQGAAPVQELAVNRELVFTGPQSNTNQLDFLTLDASYKVDDDLSLQSVLYFRRYEQSVDNGNTTEYTACTNQFAGSLCQPDGLTPLVNSQGARLPDITQAGAIPIGENDFEAIRSQGRGGSIQVSDSHKIESRNNHFTAGMAFDVAQVNFSSGSQIGSFDSALLVRPSALLVDTPEGLRFAATPVSLNTRSHYYGWFVTDNWEFTEALAVSASARYNVAQVDLMDHRGNELSGGNRFAHFNPALGATYRLTAGLTAYVSASVTNRNPTTSEIECSNPLKPCLLPSSLAADPPNLKQVIAHSGESGLRGGRGGSLEWNIGAFRTDLLNDIYPIATSLSSGFFQNIGATRREGLEAGANYHSAAWSAYAQYSYVNATFRSGFNEHSRSNPFADAAGNVQARPGDRLPGIPQQRFKTGANLKLNAQFLAGLELVVVSGQYYRGDESNQNAQLPGYWVANFHGTYRPSEHLEIFASVKNIFDHSYASFGLFGNPTGVGAPGIPAAAEPNSRGVDNRFQSPAAPRAFYGGIRLNF
jgi:iron complex outermembrane receptor protein